MLGNTGTGYITTGARLTFTGLRSQDDYNFSYSSISKKMPWNLQNKYYEAIHFKNQIDNSATTFDLSGSKHSNSTVCGWESIENGDTILNICANDGGIVYAPYDATGLFRRTGMRL